MSEIEQRSALMLFLKENSINAVFHYIPLHSSIAGKSWGVFIGEDIYTTSESEKLLRLPIYYGMDTSQHDQVTSNILNFFR